MSSEAHPRVEAVVLRSYNFESEDEENENGDDLSSLSDVFVEVDERTTQLNLNGTSGQATQLISIDDVTYDRDLKWINVPNGERPKPAILQSNRFLKQAQAISGGNRSELDALDKHYQSMDSTKRVHDKKFLVEFDTDKAGGKKDSRSARGGARRSRGRGGGNGDGRAPDRPDRRDRGDVDSVEDEDEAHPEQSYTSTHLRPTGREKRGGRVAGAGRDGAVENQETRRRGGRGGGDGTQKGEAKSKRSTRRGGRNKNAQPADSIWDQPADSAAYTHDLNLCADGYSPYDTVHYDESFEPVIYRPHRQQDKYVPPPAPVAGTDHRAPRGGAAARGLPRVPYQHPHSKYAEHSTYNRQPAAQSQYSPAAYDYTGYDGAVYYGADVHGAAVAPGVQTRYGARQGSHQYAHENAAYGANYEDHAYYAPPSAAQHSTAAVARTSEAAFQGHEAKLNPKAAEFVPATWAT